MCIPTFGSCPMPFPPCSCFGGFHQRLRLVWSEQNCWSFLSSVLQDRGGYGLAFWGGLFGARDLHPLQARFGSIVISCLQLEGDTQHLGEWFNFPSFKKKSRGTSDFSDGIDCISTNFSGNLDTPVRSHVLICEFNLTSPNRVNFKTSVMAWKLKVRAKYFRKFRTKREFVSSPQGIQCALFQWRNYRFGEKKCFSDLQSPCFMAVSDFSRD